MKKFFIFSSLIALALNASALTFYCGQHGDPEDQKNVKWSNCTWTNSLVFKVKPYKTKPGVNDVVVVRHGGFILNVDLNPEVRELIVGDSSTLVCDKRNIKVRKNFQLPLTVKGALTLADIKNSNIDVRGSLYFTLWHKRRQAGIAELRLEDSKMNVKGDIIATLPVNPLYSSDEKAGFVVHILGSTILNFEGGTLIDSIVKDDPKQFFNKFKFATKNGFVPTVKFGKDAEIESADLEFDIKGELKNGTYALAEFDKKKSGFSAVRSVKLNGKPYNFGDEVNVGGKTVVVKKGASPKSKDTKTENDILLIIR